MNGKYNFIRLIKILIVFLAIFEFSGCAMIYLQTKDKLKYNYKQGIILYRQGKYANALDNFETVQSIDPEYGDVKRYILITKEALTKKAKEYYDRGQQQKRAGNYDEALDLFNLVLKEDPDYKDTKNQIELIRNSKPVIKKNEMALKNANNYYNKKQYQKAYIECLKAKKYNPDNADLFPLMKKIEIALNSSSAPLVNNASKLYDKKNYPAARTNLIKALNLNPWDKDAKELLVKCEKTLFLERQYTVAKEKYAKRDYFTAYDLFTEINEREPGYKDSQRYIEIIANRLSANIPKYYDAGVAHYSNERFPEAIAEFNRILKINPNHQKALEYKERALAKLEMKKSLGSN
jgi:tetratricopeptide (TPR) repeat protein